MTAFYGHLVMTLTGEKRKELNVSEDKYRGLFENANEGILILKDPSFQVADMNREAEKTTQYLKEELLGKELFYLFEEVGDEKGKKLFERGSWKKGKGESTLFL